MRDTKSFLANLTHHPGVYQMLDANGVVIYVGKAKDLKKRVSSYFSKQAKDPKTLSMVSQIRNIDITITANENEAVLLECNLIKKHRPRYNILLRDDKSYPYIYISNHVYPRIDIYRGSRKKEGMYFGPFPNSLAVRETINLIQKIFKLRTCKDSYYEARSRPCLLYQIGRCTGPCVNLVSKDAYAQQVHSAILFLQGKSSELIESLQEKMEAASLTLDFELAAQYRDQINRLRQIQDKQHVNMASGDADVLGFASSGGVICMQLLTIRNGQVLGSRSYFPSVPSYSGPGEIFSAFISQHYLSDVSHIESIPKHILVESLPDDNKLLESVLTQQAQHVVSVVTPIRGEKKKWLSMAITNAKQSLSLHQFNKAHVEERMSTVQQVLNLQVLPHRFECFDISHSMGEATVASCVVFDIAGPVKSDYRRFNINDITPGDDVAAMRQVLMRRFARLQATDAKLPDVVFIDGGITQLNAAAKVLNELQISTVLLVGISKGPGRKPGFETLHRLESQPIHLASDSPALHFIQQIRDEAHRFAITGHRQRRDKVRRQSSLEAIPGIGAKRRRDLLRYFGGIQGVSHASLDELMKVPGINKSLAERIFSTLHDATI